MNKSDISESLIDGIAKSINKTVLSQFLQYLLIP